MNVLVVHPGATMSTADVHTGLVTALAARGHNIWDYALSGRIAAAGEYLHYIWKKSKKAFEQPTPGDVLYKAGEELVARALRVQPDLVLVVSAMYMHPDVFVLMKRAHLKVAVLFTESPYDDERQQRLLPYVDIAWTNERVSAVNGIRYLPHAWDAEVHANVQDDGSAPAHQVVFVGTGFDERCELLSSVDWTGIDLGLYGSWDLLGSRNKLRRYICGESLPNDRVAVLYKRAAIGLNLYRQSKGFGKGAPRISHAESLNPRAYELAAIGCFTISDARAEVTEVFGDLVPTFTTPTELRASIDRWLADVTGRARIRVQLPAAVAAHTWHARAEQIENDLLDVGIVSRPAAPLPPGADAEQPAQAMAGG